MNNENNRVTDLELKILQVIWANETAPVAAVVENWPDYKKPGYTTILKTLQKMEKKGIVGHKKEGKKYLYFANVSRDSVTSNRLGSIISQIFTGNKISFARYFLDSSDLKPEELAEIRNLIELKTRENEGQK